MNRLYRLTITLSDVINANIFGFNRLNPVFVVNIDRKVTKNADHMSRSLLDDIMSGFLWATPKRRLTLERRLVRRFGVEKYPDSSDIIRPKQNIIICDHCGHYHELHTICGNCYKRVKDETKVLLEKMKERINYFEPIDKEMEFRYENDKTNDKTTDNKRIVEVDRQRPDWFSQNLMTKSVGNKWIQKNAIIAEQQPKVLTKD
ncbi:39S ribosomal protein L32, mitochondrial-like [Oppia nitens]|uniref:39S ribosomal protein L32, mitochondrial-like n=1 Tax=Oppia nitens TaxID=1686743 RepID=UPI0023DA9F1E|nr:39S ribosomal protein L32, mitochondrial-like [Oppia nitens]